MGALTYRRPMIATMPRRIVRTRRLGLWSYLFVALLWLVLIDGFPAQLQMMVTGGSDPISPSVLKFMLLGVLALAIPLRRSIDLSEIPILLWLVCVCYLLLDFPNLAFTTSDKANFGVRSYFNYYLILLVAPFAVVFRGAMKERTVVRLLLVSFAICSMLGLAQYLGNDPILYTAAKDAHYLVMSWRFQGKVRAFSLFSSGLMFGLFTCVVGTLAVSLIRLAGRVKFGSVLLVVSAITCYATMTRNAYIIYCAAIISAWVFTSKRFRSWSRWLPLIHAAIGATITLGSTYVDLSRSNDIASNETLMLRIASWTHYGTMFVRGSWWQQAFGQGYVQSSDASTALVTPIDNVYLAIALHSGVVGVVVFMLFLAGVWKWIRNTATVQMTPLSVAIASVWSTFACVGILNILPTTYGLLAMLLPIVSVPIKKPTTCSSAFRSHSDPDRHNFSE